MDGAWQSARRALTTPAPVSMASMALSRLKPPAAISLPRYTRRKGTRESPLSSRSSFPPDRGSTMCTYARLRLEGEGVCARVVCAGFGAWLSPQTPPRSSLVQLLQQVGHQRVRVVVQAVEEAAKGREAQPHLRVCARVFGRVLGWLAGEGLSPSPPSPPLTSWDPTSPHTASITSSTSRARFSMHPPYMSVRLLASLFRNSSRM